MNTKKLLALDLKWKKLIKLADFFRFIPFIDFVAATGSMAVGNVNENSDFDVLISVRRGRIFTARYMVNFFFSIIHGRRLDDVEGSSPDKLCFNHFITENTWELKPLNSYSNEIYKNMVPLWGDEEKIKNFLNKNSAYGDSMEKLTEDLRFNSKNKSFIAKLIEFFLKNLLGDFLENKIIGPISKKRLERYLASKSKGGRVIVTGEELEFHFNPK
ncbi:nucleotidyltransferase domain-containing protein [Patescibacteria group bacterium]|nr:nucleotidyltransferase domain-containing protein [Patescibacteria group bacterium]